MQDLIQASLNSQEPVHFSGMTPSARAFFLVELQRTQPGTRIVVCPNEEQAQELMDDFLAFAGSFLQNEDEAKAVFFPTWEQSPYSSINPSLRVRLARLSVLHRLSTQKAPDFIFTTLAAACQSTLPLGFLRESTLQINLNQDWGHRDQLVQKLLQLGYLQIDPVEDPGTFGIRGEIVDIYPVHSSRPYRIELWGEMVEKIRPFDPTSQRTLAVQGASSGITSLWVPPARELLIQGTTTPFLREKIKSRCDDLGIPRTTRDPILQSIQEGVYPEHCDTWVPFAYSHPGTLWDYLPSESNVIWDDSWSCDQEWDQFLVEQTKLYDELLSEGNHRLEPMVSELFQWNPEIERISRSRTRIYLDRVALADLEDTPQASDPGVEPEQGPRTHFQVKLKDNAELEQGSRQDLGKLTEFFQLWKKQGFKTVIFASTQSQLERIQFLLGERGLACVIGPDAPPGTIALRIGELSQGFRWPGAGLVALNESEVLGSRHVKQRRTRSKEDSAAKTWSGLQALTDLSVGDAVVHVLHGIGRYQGIVRLDLSGAPSDFLLLEYAQKDKLYLPVYRLNLIQKYVGAGEAVALDRLGSQQFAKTKEKVKTAVRKLAFDLVQLYAKRKIQSGLVFTPRDVEFREFEAKFPYQETPDQLKAIDAVLADMESGRVMDRLVCGDVGYGKTEVAIRAAFKAVSDGRQVCVLVPTTLLAHQHEQSFKGRFRDYPFLIDSLSRFKSTKEQKAVLENLAKGKVDIIIGTHRLLSADVRFHDLGLVIVDEEHRFGVEHKERLKTIKTNTHVLTLTATPIPRTLHMALSGLRDISLIGTPPVDRLPIRTYVAKFDEALVQKAIHFELSRGGQAFYMHNRVQSIFEAAEKIRNWVPSAKVIVAHGQMSESELEKNMEAFYQKKANVLVCTTIIESGLDLPSANTILIERADSLGLAQLYQIRGRVGRGQQRAYAYLFIPPQGSVTEDAKKRLEVIQRYVELGSGFNIANHDLEIRGGGDLLGPEQSGNIAAVGFDLYTELLEEAIHELQGQPVETQPAQQDPEIKAPFPAFLDEKYIPDVHQRLGLYRRLSAAVNEQDLQDLEEELKDRFGAPPEEALNLFRMVRLKLLLKQMGIEILTVGKEKVSLVPGPRSSLDPVKTIAAVSSKSKKYQLTPDSKLVVSIPTAGLNDLIFHLEKVFQELK